MKRIIVGITIGVLAVFATIAIFNCWENLDANEVMVIQSPVSGDLTTFTDPGLKWQGWGKVTKYPRRSQYSFTL
jgi:hypothetical protein